MSPRTAKQPDCDVCAQAGHAAQFWHVPQLLQRVGPRWATRPSLVGPRRRKWLRERSTLKCAVCDSLTTTTYLGMEMACYRAWATAGRPDLDGWALDRRAGPKPPRVCFVCHRPTAQVYSAWTAVATRRGAWLGVPTGTTGPRRDGRGSTDERDFGPKGPRQLRNERSCWKGLLEEARRLATRHSRLHKRPYRFTGPRSAVQARRHPSGRGW